MKTALTMAAVAVGFVIGASAAWPQIIPTHRIPAALAVEAATETVAACARQGYHETAVVLDADGATIPALRAAMAPASTRSIAPTTKPTRLCRFATTRWR